MVELQTPFDEFRVVVKQHVAELTNLRPDDQSSTWYTLKYFRRILKKTNESVSPREVENTIRALIRYYLDSIEEGSDLEARIKDVLHYHRRALRLERRD